LITNIEFLWVFPVNNYTIYITEMEYQPLHTYNNGVGSFNWDVVKWKMTHLFTVTKVAISFTC